MKYSEYLSEIASYDKTYQTWLERGKKIVKRYRDEERNTNSRRRYNILYSNIQTLLPAFFSRAPKPDIERRFKDKDDIGRLAAEVWERSVAYFASNDDFRYNVKKTVMDRLLCGRGITWIRYIPHMRDVQISGNMQVKNEGEQVTEDIMTMQEVAYEEVATDYVYWEDFGHNVARSWSEVWCVWRIAYLTKDEIVNRFGEEYADIPLDYSPENKKVEDVHSKKAAIYEVWNKKDKKIVWLSKSHEGLLDEKDDFLQLDEFFPCPRPLYPILTNDTLIPVPDYAQYQDQARELDDLTARISQIVKAVKVAGVYDASAAGVQRLLNEGVENQLIPVEQWSVFAEKGALKGAISLLPMQDILQTLLGLYEAREKVKADIYEITGIADIVRGATKASETATAQTIKGQYASLRLDDGQMGAQRFCRDLVKIIAQIIANHFSLETIKQISGVKLLSMQEKQMIQVQYAPPPMMQGQPPAPPPQMPEELEELMIQPTWEEVFNVLKDNATRCFRIDIETDSTIKADQDAEKTARVEFLTAASGYFEKALPLAQQIPQLTPLLMEMLMFGVRGFRVGKQLESSFELAQQKLQKLAEQKENAPPAPDPEIQKFQAEMQMKQQEMQMDSEFAQQKMQTETQLKQQDAQTDVQIAQAKLQADIELAKTKLQFDQQIKQQELQNNMALEQQKLQAQMELENKKAILDYKSKSMNMENEEMDMEGEVKPKSPTPDTLVLAQGLQAMQEQIAGLVHHISRPKQIIRDENGNIAGVH